MPQLSHGEFQDSVVFICKHDKENSIGFVINQSIKDFSIYSVSSGAVDAEIEKTLQPENKLLWGGSVDAGRLWVIHSLDQSWEHTVKVNRQCGVTANAGTVDDILSGAKVPQNYLFLIGRVEWKAGALEREIQRGMWLSIPFEKDVLFASSCQWDILVARLGADRLTLSPISGSA